MNDFTKEELFEMLGLASNAYGIKGRTMPIIVKLQSMVNNYCEHDKLEFVGDVYGYDCKKCDKRFDSNHVGNERHERIINDEE